MPSAANEIKSFKQQKIWLWHIYLVFNELYYGKHFSLTH